MASEDPERRPLLAPLDDDPKLWPAAYKRVIIALLASMGFVVSRQTCDNPPSSPRGRRAPALTPCPPPAASTFSCTAVVPLAGRIVRDLGGRGPVSSALLITIWELGEAAGPLALAPLSEHWGRYPVVAGANGLLVAALALAATSRRVPVLVAARALTGLAVTANVLNPAIVGDLMAPRRRGAAMSLVMTAPLLGAAAGPLVGAALARWRRVLWLCAAMAALAQLLLLACLRETCPHVLVRRRAAKLRRESPPAAAAWESALRPVAILSGSAVLVLLCLFSGLAFSFAYVVCVTLPGILELVYRQPLAVQGPAFLSYSRLPPPSPGGTLLHACNQVVAGFLG